MSVANDPFSGPYFGDESSSNFSSPSKAAGGSPQSPTQIPLPSSSGNFSQQGITLFQVDCNDTSHFSPDCSRGALCALNNATDGRALADSEPHTTRTEDSLCSESADHTPSKAGAPLNDFYGIHLHSHDPIVSSPSSSSIQPPRGNNNLRLLTDDMWYQDTSHTNRVPAETLSSPNFPSLPIELEDRFGSSAYENDNLGPLSSPPTSSPPMLFSSSSLPSSQSSAIDPIEDPQGPKQGGVLLEESPTQRIGDADDAQNIDIYASSELTSPAIGSSRFAVPRPLSPSGSEPSLSEHLLLDDQYSSQEMACNAHSSRWNHPLTKIFSHKDVDANFEELSPSERSVAFARPDLLPDLIPQTAHTPVQELSLNWLSSDSNLIAGETAHTEIRSPASSPRPTSVLSSLPPSSPPEPPSSSHLGNTRSSAIENTDEASSRMEQAEMADSASSLQGACTIDEVWASDESPALFSERTTHPELLHAELPMFELDPQSLLGKRKADDRSIDARSPPSFKDKDHLLMTQDVASKSTLPNPKRPTIAAQKLQHKKLTTPFRSPALKRPKSELVSMKGPPLTAQSLTPEKEERIEQKMHPIELPAFHTIDTKKKHRTQRAAAQFKSPLSMDASSKLVSSVRMTPIIQALERKLQLLKRAVKVKQDGEEEALHALVNKWTEAGREIAWEVWELVKDNTSSEDQGWGKPQSGGKPMKSAFEDSWGWDGKSNEKSNTSHERNWGWDIEPRGTIDDNMDEMKTAENLERAEICRYEDDDMDEKKQDTLGTMLMQLGIAPETLGWNAEEGVFQGE